MCFTSQHKAINQKEYGKAVSPLRYDSLALILSCSIFVVYGKQSEKNKYICSSKRHSALHTFWDTTPENANAIIYNEFSKIRRIINKYKKKSFPLRASDSEPEGEAWVAETNTSTLPRTGYI